MSESAGEVRRFASLEVARGLAALLVVLHHTGNILAQPRFYGSEPFGGHVRNFHVGVDFFFVLSGFLIAWIHWQDIGRRHALAPYARKRFLRIYPPYWGVALPLVFLYIAIPAGGLISQHDPLNIGVSLLLLPYPAAPVLGVAWTLVHEIFFYILFGLIIRLGRKALWILPAWAAAMIIANLTTQSLDYPLSFVFSAFNLEFIIGVATAAILRHVTVPRPGILASTAVAGFLTLACLDWDGATNPLVMRLSFAVPACLFILGAVEIERKAPLPIPKPALFLGAASYAIYLVHPIALSAGARLLDKTIGATLPLDIAAIALAIGACAAGCLYHALLENRLIALARRLFFPKQQAAGRTDPETSRP